MEPLYVRNKKVFTQIGSLPFTDVKKAIDYSLRHDIPFLPELPKRGDAMMDYIKKPGKLSCLDDFCKDSFETVKIQCVGPTTILQDTREHYEDDEAVEMAYNHLSEIISRLNFKELIIFLDEPALGYGRSDFEDLWEPIMSAFPDAIWGVHVCGKMQWNLLFNSDMDIISFDASSNDITLYTRDNKGTDQRNNKTIAWGIEKASDVKEWNRGDLLTLPCGIGGKDTVHAYDRLNMLQGAAYKFR